MSKYDNPVRGAVVCPVCSSVATVHNVGEGKLIAEGEPPKNSRNLGLKYYRCPKCGNSSISKSVNAFIETNMAEDENTLDTDQPLVKEPVEIIVPEVSASNVESQALTEPTTKVKPEEKHSIFSTKRVLMFLCALMAGAWMVRTLLPKKKMEAADGDD